MASEQPSRDESGPASDKPPEPGTAPPPLPAPESGAPPGRAVAAPSRKRKKRKRKKLPLAIVSSVIVALIAAISTIVAAEISKPSPPVPTPTSTTTTTGPPTSLSPSSSSASPTSAPPSPTGGPATQIRLNGVYVIGSGIPGGIWHTSGGSSCYEATLNSTNTDDIRDNNNFTGSDTVDLTGAYAFDWDIYLTGVDLRSTLQNPQVRPGSSPPRPTLTARR
jgi:hypothetical protein